MTVLAPARAATLVLAGVVAATACSGRGVADNATTAPATTDAASTTTAEASTTTAEASTSTTTAAGFTFEDTAGGYSVRFPAEPEAQEQTLKLPDGTSVPYTINVWTDPASGADRALASAVIVYPPGTQVSLEGARDSVVASFPDATLASSDEIALQGRDGLSFAVDIGGGGSYISRIYAGDARLYQLVYVGVDVTPTDAEAKAFFDSFEFI